MPSESDQQNFLARRVLNRRPRYYNLTVPQMGAIASALLVGAGLWWLLGVLPVFASPDLFVFAMRLLGPGTLAGVLAVLFYALADDLREPVLRQALLFTVGRVLRRHTYRKESADAHTPRRARRGQPAAGRAPDRAPAGANHDALTRVRALVTARMATARAALPARRAAHGLPRWRPRIRHE